MTDAADPPVGASEVADRDPAGARPVDPGTAEHRHPDTAGPVDPGTAGHGHPDTAADPAWVAVAQRVAGVLLYAFVLLHVIDLSLLRISAGSYDRVVAVYKNPFMALLELVLLAAVLFWVLNYLRLVICDLWPRGPEQRRSLLSLVTLAWVVLMLPTLYFTLRYPVLDLFGSK